MEELKFEINKLREIYEKSTNQIIRKELRVKIFELEKNLRNLCIQHCGPLIFDKNGDWDYSEMDENNNCKICGLSITYMKT